ncbi:hypothetical protein MTR_4g122540 [Medicago truncatula]|uniref:Uncharacterized protein n=1 Tax=Medicago truncatula TaxID=3880 RepID=G7JNY8_MEDTR|nr:hypothetical protein MTR_4g122540 [Medicago truncatula]
MISEPLQDPYLTTCYQVSVIGPPTIYVHEPSPIVLVVRGCVKNDSNKEHYPPFTMPKKMINFKWVLGVRFGTKDEFNEAITNYAIYNKICLKRFKN